MLSTALSLASRSNGAVMRQVESMRWSEMLASAVLMFSPVTLSDSKRNRRLATRSTSARSSTPRISRKYTATASNTAAKAIIKVFLVRMPVLLMWVSVGLPANVVYATRSSSRRAALAPAGAIRWHRRHPSPVCR